VKIRAVTREIMGIFAAGAGFFILASLLSYNILDDPARVFPVREEFGNFGGLLGFELARALFSSFGVTGAYLIAMLGIGGSLAFLRKPEPTRDFMKLLWGSLAIVVAVAAAERALVSVPLPFVGALPEELSGRLAGGVWGTWVVHWLNLSFSMLSVAVFVAVTLFTGLSLGAEYFHDLSFDSLTPLSSLPEGESIGAAMAVAPVAVAPAGMGAPTGPVLPRPSALEDEPSGDRSSDDSNSFLWSAFERARKGLDGLLEPREEGPVGAEPKVMSPTAFEPTWLTGKAKQGGAWARAVAVSFGAASRRVGSLLGGRLAAVGAGAEESECNVTEVGIQGRRSDSEPSWLRLGVSSPGEVEVTAQQSAPSSEAESVLDLSELARLTPLPSARAERPEPPKRKPSSAAEASSALVSVSALGRLEEQRERLSERSEPIAERAEPAPKPRPEPTEKKKEVLSPDPEALVAPVSASPAPPQKPYELPSAQLLELPRNTEDEELKAAMLDRAKLIEECLAEFRIEAKIEKIQRGPNVTLYAMSIGKGIKVQRISALLDNLALVLASPGAIRIQAPIRGTSWVGLEVPNERQDMVTFREIYEQADWREKDLALPLFLGKDTSGKPLIGDLAKLPHLLVAGATGSGKSVCINTMILSLLMTRSPNEVKLILIDPKQVELLPFSSAPHLLSPVVTDMRHAGAALDWAVQKMEQRYHHLASARVRHLTEYNKLGKEGLVERLGLSSVAELEEKKIPWQLPYIVVVVDELNDLMMIAQKEVEASIMRLAQKSRAVGIHVILATQRPSVDVITGVIKSNLPARMSFQVTSKVDSRTILDVSGAEKLLGLGDMLFLAPGYGQPIRAKGAYVSEQELERVLDTICRDRKPVFADDLVALKDRPAEKQSKKRGRGRSADESHDGPCADPLFEEAVEVVLSSGRGSVTFLQRKLSIGYGRSARLVETMAECGILGGMNGSKARKILMSLEQWKAR
jgi:DNA segregation ATPase FtsK/SpoIIIE, S-DNA-T family